MNCESVYFPSEGFLSLEFSEEELFPIKNEIKKIMNNDTGFVKYNRNLAGHIEKEYELTNDCKCYVQNLILPCIEKYKTSFGDIKYCSDILTKDVPYVLDKLWVNLQQKYEFNPNHQHSGAFSFVIWIQCPYDMNKERRFSSLEESKKLGCFEMIYTGNLGNLKSYSILTDKSMEGKGVFFPSTLTHCVYPFFSSDEYRISISGNIRYEV